MPKLTKEINPVFSGSDPAGSLIAPVYNSIDGYLYVASGDTGGVDVDVFPTFLMRIDPFDWLMDGCIVFSVIDTGSCNCMILVNDILYVGQYGTGVPGEIVVVGLNF